MGAKSGVALKFLQWFIRGVQFCCAALILAIYSYFLATLHNHDLPIADWIRAVEGISGIAVVYTALGLLLLCCLAGRSVTSFIAIALDVCFVGAFIYVASANRGGVGSCRGTVNTPFGTGNADTNVSDDGNGGFTNLPSFYSACKLETACFAVSIVAIIFFIFSALVEFALGRHHQKEKRFGPSPANDYTSGYGSKRRGFFSRRSKRADTMEMNGPNVLPEHTHPDAVRNSYNTDTTAVGGTDALPAHKYKDSGYEYDTAPGLLHEEPGHATYPPGNYRYEDGVYNGVNRT